MVMATHILPIPVKSVPLTETALCQWLGAAAPGDTITYFRGALARSVCPLHSSVTADERNRVAKLAGRAWKLAELGLAHLVQRRHGFEDCSYILIVARRPRQAGSSLLPRILAEAA